MRPLLAALLLSVILHMSAVERYACPGPPPPHPTPQLGDDGRYWYLDDGIQMNTDLVMHYSTWNWDEMWSDLPENGGQFQYQIGERHCRQ